MNDENLNTTIHIWHIHIPHKIFIYSKIVQYFIPEVVQPSHGMKISTWNIFWTFFMKIYFFLIFFYGKLDVNIKSSKRNRQWLRTNVKWWFSFSPTAVVRGELKWKNPIFMINFPFSHVSPTKCQFYIRYGSPHTNNQIASFSNQSTFCLWRPSSLLLRRCRLYIFFLRTHQFNSRS